MDFISLFKQEQADKKRGKYLSRLFGIFSEEIVRIWAADENCHYEDLGRPSIQFKDKSYTLDFTLRHKQSKKVYIVEQKCEIEYQNYKFFVLDNKEQLSHHTKNAFVAFLEVAKKNIISASIKKQEIKIDGTILIWGTATPKGINDIKLEYRIDDVLTLEKIIEDLISWKNGIFYKFIRERMIWSIEMLSGLLSIKSIERESPDVIEAIASQNLSIHNDMTALLQDINFKVKKNDIKPPIKEGKCMQVWKTCEVIFHNTLRCPTLKEVKEKLPDSNPTNIKIELHRWRKYHGFKKINGIWIKTQ